MLDKAYELFSQRNDIVMSRKKWHNANLAAALDLYDVLTERGLDPVEDVVARIRYAQRFVEWDHIVMLTTLQEKWSAIASQEDRTRHFSERRGRPDRTKGFERR